MSIFQNETIWMRNARTMNDFSEIEHGKQCLISAYHDEQICRPLKEMLEKIYPGFVANFEAVFNSWMNHFSQNTFLTSLSEHGDEEDTYGRLSMWRAYGAGNGVALILNNAPFLQVADALKAYSSPVAYKTPFSFAHDFREFVQRITGNEELISSIGREHTLWWIFTAFRMSMLCTKHPGFSEEREWRIIYSPTLEKSKAIQRDYAIIRGVPQEIYKIPLRHDPENGLFNADVPSLLNRMIIGPSQQPFTVFQALTSVLAEKGVQDIPSKVAVSDIPLRQG